LLELIETLKARCLSLQDFTNRLVVLHRPAQADVRTNAPLDPEADNSAMLLESVCKKVCSDGLLCAPDEPNSVLKSVSRLEIASFRDVVELAPLLLLEFTGWLLRALTDRERDSSA
jgi:hypothetical protein